MSKKLHFFCILILVCSMNYGQTNYETGSVDYGIDINKETISKAKNKIRSDNSYASKMILRILKANKKIHAQDINFLNMKFKKDRFIVKPIDIMLPESTENKFYLESSAYYVDFKNDIYLKQFNRRSSIYIAPFKKDYDWKIKNEEKSILGFTCRKAVLKIPKDNKVIAWFTPQIPVAFSPVQYYGLPGAILEITTPLKHIYAKNIEFKDDVEVEKPTDGIKLTAEEYKEMISKFKPPE